MSARDDDAYGDGGDVVDALRLRCLVVLVAMERVVVELMGYLEARRQRRQMKGGVDAAIGRGVSSDRCDVVT